MTQETNNGIGIILAQRLTGMLTGAPDTTYETMSTIVHGELLDVARMMGEGGASAVLPDGTTLSVSFKPASQH